MILKKTLKVIGLKNKKLVIRIMRHSFITRIFESNIDIKTISVWAGHNNVETTKKIYIHLLSEYEKKQAIKFDPKSDPKN